MRKNEVLELVKYLLAHLDLPVCDVGSNCDDRRLPVNLVEGANSKSKLTVNLLAFY